MFRQLFKGDRLPTRKGGEWGSNRRSISELLLLRDGRPSLNPPSGMSHAEGGNIYIHVSAKDNRKLNRPISPLLLLPTAQPTVIGSEMGGGSGDERRRGKGGIGRRKRGEISTKLGKATLYRRCRRSVPPSVHGIIVRQHHDGCSCCGAVASALHDDMEGRRIWGGHAGAIEGWMEWYTYTAAHM